MAFLNCFLWPNSIPLCIYSTSCLSIHLPCCFHDLEIVSCAAVKFIVICKLCCYKHWGTCMFLNYSFLWIYAWEWDCWVIWQLSVKVLFVCFYCFFIFRVLRNLSTVTLSAFVICRLFNDGLSFWCEAVPFCSFDFHFSNN